MQFEVGQKVYWKQGLETKSGLIIEAHTVVGKTFIRKGRERTMPKTEWIIKGDDGKQYSKPEKELFLQN